MQEMIILIYTLLLLLHVQPETCQKLVFLLAKSIQDCKEVKSVSVSNDWGR